jgi:long-chain acyl-CoA synthetase
MTSPAPLETLAELFLFATAKELPHHLSHRRNGEIVHYSTTLFRQRTIALASALRDRGIERGDRVAILCENRPEWHIVDFACHLIGAVVVPVYLTLSPARMRFLLKHSGAAAVAISAAGKHVDTFEQIRQDLPDLRLVLTVDSLDELLPLADEKPILAAARATRRDDLATLIYTSGTTGDPKGVMLTHANLVFNIYSTRDRLDLCEHPQAMAVLPLAHIFERSLCYSYLFRHVPIAYGDPQELIELLPIFQPTLMAVVPRILEKVHERVLSQIAEMPSWKQTMVRELMEGQKSHRWLTPLVDRLMFAKLRERFGGRVQYLISGGAALRAATGQFFLDAGIAVNEGYGLSETSPVIAVNPPGQVRLGTVGTVVPGVEVKIDGDGELLVRGGNVMKGYWKDPIATNDALRDGWFHTGDLAQIDAEGYVTITGRKKEIIVTAGGKKISHHEIEELLCQSPLIQTAILIGDGRKFLSAVLVPQRAALTKEALARNWPLADYASMLASPAVHALYAKELATLQADLSGYEQVKEFILLPEETLQDPEFLTPTQKIRRKNLERHLQPQLDSIYSAH